ncbi:MAG TPA: UDP-N-acetylmuramoyl-tripeptide--D-alanyl-D-alanine ligase [Flavobacterium sp.]|nr:UDP-N-acetylmuramoyl-tripeptide--D-alanyl-D-alanine ligase [Flavobacterium sp.]
MDLETIYSKFLECTTVSIDTREISKGSLFIALKGLNFDANIFAKEALKKGAKYVIIDNKDYFINEQTILVEDCLNTLQQLAKYHRKTLGTTLIGLTGSNGKTTTKELIHAVLSTKYKTIATFGNLNNHIGVPLTLLRLSKETEIGIIEMGANHQKEIEFLCAICQPNYGLVTNFGKAHLEGFGGEEGVIKGKTELYQNLFQNNGTLFYNADDEKQNQILIDYQNKIGFSATNHKNTLQYKINNTTENVEIFVEDMVIRSNLFGKYNANNLMYAVLIGKHFKVSQTKIKNAIENYLPQNNRSQKKTTEKNYLILDSYNANPTSMSFAIKEFYELKTEKTKLCILGDMFELGENTKVEHENILNLLRKFEMNSILVGTQFYLLKNNYPEFNFYETTNHLKDSNLPASLKNQFILIKGSRGVQLEKIYEDL